MEIINSSKDGFSEDKHENFHLDKIKVLETFTMKNIVQSLCMLNDGRLLTNECLWLEEEEKGYDKLCVYTIKNGLECDINIDFQLVKDIYPLNDGNVLMILTKKIIIIKINKNSIEELWSEDGEKIKVNKLLNENFFIKKKSNKAIYKYDNGKLIIYKNLNELNKKENIFCLCQITENEYAFITDKKKIFFGEKSYVIFYDMKKETKIKSLKLGDVNDCFNYLCLFNKNNMLVFGIHSIILVDTVNKKIKKELKYTLFFEDCVFLNEKLILHSEEHRLTLYEYIEPNDFVLKEKKDMKISEISKYPGNKLIYFCSSGNKLGILG